MTDYRSRTWDRDGGRGRGRNLARGTLFAFGLSAVACGSPGVQGTATQAPTPPSAQPPTLVVMLTVDQLRPDYLQRFEAQLTGGLGRLYRGSAVLTDAAQDHANTETAPGHATILSGREPRNTGILYNEVGVPDPNHPLIGGGGAGASPFRFRGTTLIDWMRARTPGSRALSISRKDRSAILPIGRSKDQVFWYASNGRFTTSSYYADTLPTWLRQFNDRRLPHSYTGKTWDLLLPASQYPEPDSVRFENGGRTFLFPHVASSDTARAVSGFVEFPWMDEVTLAAALDGLNALRLGTGAVPDLLAISLSSTDAIGHRYGPDSREVHDQVLRLDRALGVFLDSLFRLRDSSRVVIALTADHGVTPYPELAGNRTPGAQWVSISTVVTRTRAAVTAAGAPASAFQFLEALVTLDRPALMAARVNADSLRDAFAAEVRRLPGIARVDRYADLASADTSRDAIARRWLKAIPTDSPVELIITLTEGSAWGRAGSSATHGGPWDADALVPILFYGSPFKPGRYTERASVADIAPTLARVLGITPTEPLDGRVRAELIR
jgi:predicted AlkP superfamily pyrophosphatase or phosphodiesterase